MRLCIAALPSCCNESIVLAKFPIVGIGASAGGVEALEGLFAGVPADSGCAFVIVTHLPPERRSLLPEILSRYTPLTVQAATDDSPVRPNEIYVLPSNAVLRIEQGRLKLEQSNSEKRERKPIDVFLSELARDQGEYAAGVILSGADGDGTLGVKAIKERGGLTIAQVADGKPPLHSDMPQSAISSGMIDLAIPVGEMGSRLARFARDVQLLDGLASAQHEEEQALGDAEARREICLILRSQLGHDFSGYKAKTFMRRVIRRMQVIQADTLESYVACLRQEPKEVTALFRDLLINVTNFFRDGEAFETLAEQVLPKIFAQRGADETVRVWVPGCATGEEVYSIAILMREHMETLNAVPRVQLFATDIDDRALSVARSGRYPAALLESVSPERRQRFFVQDGASLMVAKDVRELCIFSPHSVIRDPPFSRLDLVSCRNLLIYFGAAVQAQVIPTFHYALRPGGFLFLGLSENATQFAELFAPIDKKNRIFRSREGVSPRIRVSLGDAGLKPRSSLGASIGHKRSAGSAGFRQSVERQVLERFAPAHVVVNAEGDVVYYSARTGKYLEQIAGAPSQNLMTMARKGLRLDLHAALGEAVQTETRVIRQNLAVEGDDERVQFVSIAIEPFVEKAENDSRLFVVVFTDMGASLSREQASERATSPETDTGQLERELRDTRERLQSSIEEYETAVEELRSSNEELQSSNEELEASKEEHQSLNEELHTVNTELMGKVDALDRVNSDLSNLFASTKVATIFLDRNLAIRMYTPEVSAIFNILPVDRGRPLTDLTGRIPLPTLSADVHQVLSEGEVVERTIEHQTGAGPAQYLLRIAPYHDQGAQVDGIVLTFVDITSIQKAEDHQRVLIAELNHRVKNMLTVVISIAEQTFRTTQEPSEVKNRLVGRVEAMAHSYELLSQENWTGAQVDALIAPELAPFGLDRVKLEGPPVKLEPRRALSLGMVIHELATNASKYGALGDPKGQVSIAWSVEPTAGGEQCSLTWRESDGPAVAEPSTRGFGLKLVEREAGYVLGGSAKVEFLSTGLVVKMRFPLGDQKVESAGGE